MAGKLRLQSQELLRESLCTCAAYLDGYPSDYGQEVDGMPPKRLMMFLLPKDSLQFISRPKRPLKLVPFG